MKMKITNQKISAVILSITFFTAVFATFANVANAALMDDVFFKLGFSLSNTPARNSQVVPREIPSDLSADQRQTILFNIENDANVLQMANIASTAESKFLNAKSECYTIANKAICDPDNYKGVGGGFEPTKHAEFTLQLSYNAWNAAANDLANAIYSARESQNNAISYYRALATPVQDVLMEGYVPQSIDTSADTGTGGLIPCSGSKCGFNDLIILSNNIIKFLMLKVAVPLAALGIMFVGAKMVLSSNKESAKTEAKESFTNIAIGFLIMLGAYVFIKTIIFALLSDEQKNFMQFMFQ